MKVRIELNAQICSSSPYTHVVYWGACNTLTHYAASCTDILIINCAVCIDSTVESNTSNKT